MAIRFSVTVYEWQRAVLFKDGRLQGVLPPGRHSRWFGNWSAMMVDTRSKIEVVGNQEVPTRDEIPVRVSVFVTYRIEDPAQWITAAEDSRTLLHATAQTVLRDSVARRTLDEVPENRTAIAEELTSGLAKVAGRIGISIESSDMRDFTYPGPVRDAMVAVVRARKEALASLEKARGEHSALRSLLNAARLLDDHPGLLTLRTLQAAEAGNSTLIVGDLKSGNLPMLPRAEGPLSE